MRALGIDVGVGKGLDLVLLDDRRVPVRVMPKVGVEQIPRAIEEMVPDVIAIDAPPAWAADGRSRLTERVLAERNIRTFATPTRARGKGTPFYDWMEVADPRTPGVLTRPGSLAARMLAEAAMARMAKTADPLAFPPAVSVVVIDFP